jgi:hypothetical protein
LISSSAGTSATETAAAAPLRNQTFKLHPVKNLLALNANS